MLFMWDRCVDGGGLNSRSAVSSADIKCAYVCFLMACCSYYISSSSVLHIQVSSVSSNSFTCSFFLQLRGPRVFSSSRPGCRAPPLTPSVSTHWCDCWWCLPAVTKDGWHTDLPLKPHKTQLSHLDYFRLLKVCECAPLKYSFNWQAVCSVSLLYRMLTECLSINIPKTSI